MSRVVSTLMLLALVGLIASHVEAADVLVADRLSNSVYRYSETGDYLGLVVTDHVNINQATGLALSPDLTKLYVSSFQTGKVIRYDYDYKLGTASNGEVFADGSDGLASPSDIQFSADGKTIYVSNLGSTGVARFQLDGSSAGEPLLFDPPHELEHSQFSGLAFAPNGKLLVGSFIDFPAGTSGAIGSFDGSESTLEFFVQPSPTINGASGLLVHEDYLYVTGMFASAIQRFDLATGQRDSAFNVNGLPFPQGLMLSPDGNGFLTGILGFANGQGHIAHYDFDGNLVGDGVFAENVSQTGVGFEEATAMIIVPERLAGDFNGDQRVDAADYLVWRNTLGSTTDLRADANGDGMVDGDDYLAWKQEFVSANGAALASPAHSVPEPAGLVLFALALLAATLKRLR